MASPIEFKLFAPHNKRLFVNKYNRGTNNALSYEMTKISYYPLL